MLFRNQLETASFSLLSAVTDLDLSYILNADDWNNLHCVTIVNVFPVKV